MSREVLVNINSKEETIGLGAKAFRSIGTNEHTNFDPFLLIDELVIDPDRGLPDHPHRGIEAITYVLKGQTINEDSNGYMSVIGPGDAQCITVGKGVMHGMMPIGREPCRSIQIWLNLPKKFKMTEPMYQDIKNAEIPKTIKDGVHLKVIAGRAGELKSPMKTMIPILILDFKLDRNASFTQPIPNEWAAFIYILEGTGAFGRLKRIEGKEHSTILLTKGNGVFFKNSSTTQLHFLLIAGQQLNEPVFRKGPYIMNTQNEINEAIKDFEQGKNGFEKALGWKSQAIKRLTPPTSSAPSQGNNTNTNTTNINSHNNNHNNSHSNSHSNHNNTNNNTHSNTHTNTHNSTHSTHTSHTTHNSTNGHHSSHNNNNNTKQAASNNTISNNVNNGTSNNAKSATTNNTTNNNQNLKQNSNNNNNPSSNNNNHNNSNNNSRPSTTSANHVNKDNHTNGKKS